MFFDDGEPPGPVCHPHAPADPRPSSEHVDGTAGVRFLRAGTRTPVPISAEAYARALHTARQVECDAPEWLSRVLDDNGAANASAPTAPAFNPTEPPVVACFVTAGTRTKVAVSQEAYTRALQTAQQVESAAPEWLSQITGDGPRAPDAAIPSEPPSVVGFVTAGTRTKVAVSKEAYMRALLTAQQVESAAPEWLGQITGDGPRPPGAASLPSAASPVLADGLVPSPGLSRSTRARTHVGGAAASKFVAPFRKDEHGAVEGAPTTGVPGTSVMAQTSMFFPEDEPAAPTEDPASLGSPRAPPAAPRSPEASVYDITTASPGDPPPPPPDVEDGSVPPPADPGVAASVISAIDETPKHERRPPIAAATGPVHGRERNRAFATPRSASEAPPGPRPGRTPKSADPMVPGVGKKRSRLEGLPVDPAACALQAGDDRPSKAKRLGMRVGTLTPVNRRLTL